MVVVKYCKLNIIEDIAIQYYIEMLPLFMREEILRYKYSADQKARLLSRLMLVESIMETGINSNVNEWKRDINNKPFIESWYIFNISHSANYVVFAYTTEKTLGIDIEKKIDLRCSDIIDLFHPEEQEFVKSAEDFNTSFYNMWVKKESLLKAVGLGITSGLNDSNCLRNIVNYQGKLWYLKQLHIHCDYTCYVCTSSLTKKVSVQEFKINF